MEINVRGWKWAREAPGGMLEPGIQEWPVLITRDRADSKQLGKHRGVCGLHQDQELRALIRARHSWLIAGRPDP